MKSNQSLRNVDCKMQHLMEELLTQELLLAKKCSAYSNTIFDSELKNICYIAGKKHEDNYNLLLSYLS
ncbi:hypothetical protein [Proteiniborus ethanoligenes]|uniref:hypothetical protein n=1 Tax=Proteiniborus ethanoligenes TaxID=415015 RepID=UPI000B81096A|nr:hypothetical protein [Proteiniborus ethanoligenes]